MVETVRRTRAGGLAVVTAPRAAAERCARNGSTAVEPSSRRGREYGLREATTRAGRLAAFLQRAAGFLRRQAFLAAVAHCRGLSDASAGWFAESLARKSPKNGKKGFLSVIYIRKPENPHEARSTSSKQKIEETV